MIKEKTLVSLVQLLVGVSFFVPLVVLPSSFIFPFIVPKILLFRSLVLILLAVYALLLYSNWETYRPRLTPLNLAVFGFWLSFAISTFVGVDWYRSFWDNHERMLGLFTVSHYVLLYYVLVAVLRDQKQWQSLLRWFLSAGSLVMIIALCQKIDPELLLNRGSSRVSSTLGNPIYVSGYGLFLLFFAAISYVRTQASDTLWRYVAIASGVLGFLGIFLGGTRGTFLGLIVAGALLLCCFGCITKERTYRLGIVGIALLGVVALVGAWTARESAIVQSITPIARLVALDVSALQTNTRVMAWGIAWESFLEKPVFGWGPNNYYYAFNQYYRPEFLRYGYGETWFDNAHNIVMNTLSTQGAFGIVTYVAVFVVVGWLLFRAYREERLGGGESSLLFAFFVGHFVHNIFVFENPTSYLYFFFALGYVAIRTIPVPMGETRTRPIAVPTIVVSGGIVLFALYICTINPAHANTSTLRAIQALYLGGGVAEYAVAASTPSPHIDDVRNDFARTASQVVPSLMDTGKRTEALALITLSIEELEKNNELHPMDIRVHILLAQLYQQRAVIEQQADYLVTAMEFIQSAQIYSPRRQQLLYTLANMHSMVGNTTSSVALFVTARDLDPVVGEGWVQLARAYAASEDTARIEALRREFDTVSSTIRFRSGERVVFDGLLMSPVASPTESGQ